MAPIIVEDNIAPTTIKTKQIGKATNKTAFPNFFLILNIMPSDFLLRLFEKSSTISASTYSSFLLENKSNSLFLIKSYYTKRKIIL
jgi:hypothetical protein